MLDNQGKTYKKYCSGFRIVLYIFLKRLTMVNIFFNYGDQIGVLYFKLEQMHMRKSFLRPFIFVDLKLFKN